MVGGRGNVARIRAEHEQAGRFWCDCETTGYFAARVCFDAPRDISYMHICALYKWLVSLMIGRIPSFCWVVGVPSGLDFDPHK